jgi:hypothetical protein
VAEFVLFGLRAEVQPVDFVDDVTEVVAAGDLFFDFAEDLADLVLDGLGSGGALGEAVEVGEELLVDEVAEVVAGEGLVVVNLAVFVLRRGPDLPLVGLFEDERVFFAFEGGFVGLVVFQFVEVFEEEEPGGLLGVVEFGSASRFFAQDVVDILEACSNMSYLCESSDCGRKFIRFRRSSRYRFS